MRFCYAKKGADYAIEEFILFDKYRVISTLGSGTFGTVYLAEHLKLKVFRAIKCIPKKPAHQSSLSLEEDFFSEAHLLKNLNHPGIPLIYDIDEDIDYVYMIEEFIQGESLDTFVLHQENISPDLIIKLGIQLCDILDYLHHLSPYPILYQDLKPEHIILCGDQLKLIDFGIASFFTGSGNHFQIYGTDGFAAPEALGGQPVTPLSDIYSLGRILEFLAGFASPGCSPQMLRIINQALEKVPSERFSSAASLKSALTSVQTIAGSHSSHLIRNIAVLGSRIGAGATHFSVSLVSTLNKKGFCALYIPVNEPDTLTGMAENNYHIREQNGTFHYEYFRALPSYGIGVEQQTLSDSCLVKDYGISFGELTSLKTEDLIFFILSGSDWDYSSAIALGNRLNLLEQTIFICNFQNKKAAKKFARAFGKKVYCFPYDENPYRITSEKERLISAILKQKGGIPHFSF